MCGRRVHCRKPGFTLIELLVVIAIIALLIGILLPALGEARKSGRVTICQSNMKQLGVATQSYTADYADRLYAFTISNKSYDLLAYADLRSVAQNGDALRCHSAQAVDIIRRRTGRDDFELPDAWIPDVLYTHLVLQDYLASRLPEKLVICPEDKNRLLWQTDPVAFANGAFIPSPNPLSSRWPYSSTYETNTFHYAPDRCDNGPGVTQGGQHNQYQLIGDAGEALGRRKIPDVAFPSQKAQLYDIQCRHKGKVQFYYGYADAVCPILFYDGSVTMRRTGPPTDPIENGVRIPLDANPGCDPSRPTSPFALLVNYTPDTWESPIRGGGTSASFPGFYRWTRLGLRGIDFGGSEVKIPGT
ncbi:MAG: prepilin-type N-terminal cleavage/methylation domain-containing protein [Planctomycetes bacterium]|nr:prepilin-type N-terminal cleavage/methylation domain-containing protein [Planctomycetota bacterium]